MKRLIAILAAFGAVLLMALPTQASGAGAVSFTQTFHNVTQTFTSGPMAANPCNGQPGTLTITYNGVMHGTVLNNGTGWFTFTATGDATFLETDNAVTYTGHFTAWDGQSFNLQNFAATGILVGHLTGSDGSSLDFHDVMHITVLAGNPPSVVVNFDKLTCG